VRNFPITNYPITPVSIEIAGVATTGSDDRRSQSRSFLSERSPLARRLASGTPRDGSWLLSTSLVTISTDNITETNEFRSGVGAHWPFLSDPRRVVQKNLDIAEYTDPAHNPMIPHTLVLEPGLIIYKIYMGYWFFGRPTVEDLRQDLRAVLKKCRPDRDITTSELKGAWKEGRKELFYPYGKSYAQIISEQD